MILGMTTWFAASHWLASSIIWVEGRYPNLIGSKGLRVYESVVCGLLVLACFAVAVFITLML